MYEEYEYEEEYVEPPICNIKARDIFSIEELNKRIPRAKGCVYFFKIVGLSPVKIGYSDELTPEKRLKSFSFPHGIERLGYFSTVNARLVEQEIHKMLSQYRLKGEWFDITEEKVTEIIMTYNANYNNERQRAMMLIQTHDVDKLIEISRGLKRPSVQITEQGTIKDVFIQHNPTNTFTYKKDFLTYCEEILNKSSSQIYRFFRKESHLFEKQNEGRVVKIRLCV
tara:strand:- start:42 stop:716 length:675 start_codon:yes stop_codon:yes gene_type:complete